MSFSKFVFVSLLMASPALADPAPVAPTAPAAPQPAQVTLFPDRIGIKEIEIDDFISNFNVDVSTDANGSSFITAKGAIAPSCIKHLSVEIETNKDTPIGKSHVVRLFHKDLMSVDGKIVDDSCSKARMELCIRTLTCIPASQIPGMAELQKKALRTDGQITVGVNNGAFDVNDVRYTDATPVSKKHGGPLFVVSAETVAKREAAEAQRIADEEFKKSQDELLADCKAAEKGDDAAFERFVNALGDDAGKDEYKPVVEHLTEARTENKFTNMKKDVEKATKPSELDGLISKIADFAKNNDTKRVDARLLLEEIADKVDNLVAVDETSAFKMSKFRIRERALKEAMNLLAGEQGKDAKDVKEIRKSMGELRHKLRDTQFKRIVEMSVDNPFEASTEANKILREISSDVRNKTRRTDADVKSLQAFQTLLSPSGTPIPVTAENPLTGDPVQTGYYRFGTNLDAIGAKARFNTIDSEIKQFAGGTLPDGVGGMYKMNPNMRTPF